MTLEDLKEMAVAGVRPLSGILVASKPRRERRSRGLHPAAASWTLHGRLQQLPSLLDLRD